MSKYVNPQLYREPEYPRITTTSKAEEPRKVINAKPVSRRKWTTWENSCNSGNLRPQIDSQKASTLNSVRRLPWESRRESRVLDDDWRFAASAHVQCSKIQEEDIEGDPVMTEVNYPPARKLGSLTPDWNPPLLSVLPRGRLTNK